VGADSAGVAVTPDGKTAFVANLASGTVSAVDVKTRTKRADIPVGPGPLLVAVTPDAKTAFVANNVSNTVSTIDVKTRTKHPTDIDVGPFPYGVAVTPDGKTAFVTKSSGTLSTFDVKTRRKNADDIAVGTNLGGSRSRPTARPPSSPTRPAARCRPST
jgi:YVTN family beta-propeller protein